MVRSTPHAHRQGPAARGSRAHKTADLTNPHHQPLGVVATMTTTASEQESARSKRDEGIANTCGIAAIALIPCFALYYALVSTHVLNPPPGLSGVWAITVVGLGFVKINTWIVDRRVSATEDRHAYDLAEVRDELRALREALLHEGEQAASELLTQADRHLNGRSVGSVSHLSTARPGS